MQTRPAIQSDFSAVLALNEESVQFLSPLSGARLAHLHLQSDLHQVIEVDRQVVAFLLAFREAANYDSVNFQWFAHRYERFLYIDRVVVNQSLRANGAGTLLYRQAFIHAAATGVRLITCEFDVEPPNPVSERFHAKFGFREVGRQRAGQAKKLVSLQAAHVPEQNAA